MILLDGPATRALGPDFLHVKVRATMNSPSSRLRHASVTPRRAQS